MPKPCRICGTVSQRGLCREHRKVYDKSFYSQHAVTKTASAVKRKRSLLDWYRALKHGKSCGICGFAGDECQMDYDHKPGHIKFMEVSKMVRLGYEREKIALEIAKCWLLCANCHRLLTKTRRKQKVRE